MRSKVPGGGVSEERNVPQTTRRSVARAGNTAALRSNCRSSTLMTNKAGSERPLHGAGAPVRLYPAPAAGAGREDHLLMGLLHTPALRCAPARRQTGWSGGRQEENLRC
ncbi:unnamed protein product [Lota lota]